MFVRDPVVAKTLNDTPSPLHAGKHIRPTAVARFCGGLLRRNNAQRAHTYSKHSQTLAHTAHNTPTPKMLSSAAAQFGALAATGSSYGALGMVLSGLSRTISSSTAGASTGVCVCVCVWGKAEKMTPHNNVNLPPRSWESLCMVQPIAIAQICLNEGVWCSELAEFHHRSFFLHLLVSLCLSL